MDKKILIPTILFLIILPVSIFALTQEKSKKESTQNPAKNNNAKIVLYFKTTCPHCRIVEEWISQNNIADKVSFSQKDVTTNIGNANELLQRAEFCKIPDDEIGVPFLWDGEDSRCLMGDTEIINFFENKISANANNPAQESPVASESNINKK